ncbi:NAD-dependent epimerase/dehydratase family protein [Ferrovibrio sp.]|uniref:NAD-dependent epimerase/dehydratase family protein n=1 Tax=Ferrovibrio sp. TaxID=1917215 RepID=UPI000CB094A1|nr:NAD-dependent epimerase/dehydratase family protein [Ferrovibrio sp.]PJI38645.1 MAG: epimerase [Ferrovibrio sp.]
MPTFLVTGGCGFIGSHLVDLLLRQGHRVRVLDDLSTGRTHNLAPEAELMIGDVADAAIVALAMKGVMGCFHLAADTSLQTSAEDWLRSHRTNLTGTITIFEAACSRAVPVVYASSAAVYGDSGDQRLSEMAPARPLNAYGADKLGCELHARIAASLHGVPTAGLRFFNVYGPRQDPASSYTGVISIFAARAMDGEPMQLHGDGEQLRDFIFVADTAAHLVAAMDRLLERQRDRRPAAAGVFNVCTGQPTRIRELAAMIARLSGRPLRLQSTPARAGDIRRSLGDPSAAIRHLRIAATTALEDGLRQTLSRLQPPTPTNIPGLEPVTPFGVHWSSRLLSQ